MKKAHLGADLSKLYQAARRAGDNAPAQEITKRGRAV